VPTHAKTNDRRCGQGVEEYQTQYREARKTWPIIPYDEIIKESNNYLLGFK
jgi:hypothetical protein